MTLNLSYLEYN